MNDYLFTAFFGAFGYRLDCGHRHFPIDGVSFHVICRKICEQENPFLPHHPSVDLLDNTREYYLLASLSLKLIHNVRLFEATSAVGKIALRLLPRK
jgi:hypothetical protein